MKVKTNSHYFVISIVGVLLFALIFIRQSAAQSDEAAILQDAWRNTERAGSYEFVTELTETRLPAPRITSVGRPAAMQSLYVEGLANRSTGQLDLSVWNDMGRVHERDAAIEVQVDGLAVRGRTLGGEWQQMDDISSAFAPTGDAASFLLAAKDVMYAGQESAEIPDGRGVTTFDRYTFSIDGDQYAEYMRLMLQQQLRDAGELPHGMTLSASDAYRQMFARGEAWIDGNGLPLRLTVEMEFPQDRRGERRTLDIKTNFVEYGDDAAVFRIRTATQLENWAAQLVGELGQAARGAAPAFGVSATLFALLGMAVLLQRSRPKLFHSTFATLLSAQMAFAPLTSFLDLSEMDAFRTHYPELSADFSPPDPETAISTFETQAPQRWGQPLDTLRAQAEQEAAIVAQTNMRAVNTNDDRDSDGDNLSDDREARGCKLPDEPYSHPDNVNYPTCSNSTAADNDNDGQPDGLDTDGDGLTDGEEVLILGTYPNDPDSDGDGLTDYVEVRGFLSMGERQYSNPLSADTDGDGQMDGIECSDLRDISDEDWTEQLACNNRISSTHANILVVDDDGDGVPTPLDLSPLSKMAPTLGFFGGETAFELVVEDLTQGEPVVVDVQIRPEKEEHLSFALNYLDWPTGDTEGQVQRQSDSTFGSVNNSALDDPARNGDMRVVPMLEVTLPEDTLELPRVPAETGFDLTDRGRIMGEIRLSSFGSAASFDVLRLANFSGQLTVGKGTCASHEVVETFTVRRNDDPHLIASHTVGDLVDGKHILKLEILGRDFCEPLTELEEGMSELDFTFQSPGIELGQVEMTTSSVGYARFEFANLTRDYHVRVYNSGCKARNASDLVWSHDTANAGNVGIYSDDLNNSGSNDGPRMVDVANGSHSLTLAIEDGTETISCTDIPNVINGSHSEMFDTAKLATYQLTLSEGENNEVVAMLPLSLATDSTTGERVAFNGRMYFEHGSSGALAAQMNLIWIIVALTDVCPASGCTPSATDKTQIIHTYRNEKWLLTGLRVEEEQGYDVALFYEDPTTDQVEEGMSGTELANRSLELDDNLWALMRGLRETFLTGQNLDGNSQRDYRVDNFAAIFDTTATMTSTQSFGIRPDALNVVTRSYEQQADLEKLVNDVIPTTLNDAFGDGEFDVESLGGHPQTTVQPLLVFATEQTARALDLDSVALEGDALITTQNNKVTVNFDKSKVKPTVFSGLSWKPFRYENGAWQAAPIESYLDRFKGNLRSTPFADGIEEEKFEVEGNLILAELIFLSYYKGRANAVEYAGELAWTFDPSSSATPTFLSQVMNHSTSQVVTAGGTMGAWTNEVADGLQAEQSLFSNMRAGSNPDQVIAANDFKLPAAVAISIAGGAAPSVPNSFLKSTTNFLKSVGGVKGFVATVGAKDSAMILAGLTSIYLDANGSQNSHQRPISITLKSLAVADELNNVRLTYKAFKAFKDVNNNAGFNAFAKAASATKAAKVMAIVGLAISIGVAVVVFFVAWANAEVGFFSLGFNLIFANMVASVILTLLLALIATTGIGLIAVSIVALIDAVISLFCAIFPPDEENTAANAVCKGIAGWLTTGIAWLIYDQTDIVGMDDPNRLQPSLNMFLGDPEDGFATDAAMRISMNVVNTVELRSADSLLSGLYAWQFKESNARKATFAYDISGENITDQDKQLHSTAKLALNKHPSEWAKTDDEYAITRSFENTVTLPSEAGINRPIEAYLVEGSATPVQECAMVPNVLTLAPPAVPVCKISTRDNSIYTDLGLTFDIFPDELSKFYALVDKDGGKALAWGQNGEVTSPRLIDADGDGLTYQVDDDDGDYDNDNDGLSDLRETESGTLPNNSDSDDDGLEDADELFYGTNPTKPDTDNDGIPDGEEINGWSIVYNTAGHTTRAWPNPLEADADGDGVIDRVEKSLGTNPNVSGNEDALAYEPLLIEKDAPLLLFRFDEAVGATKFVDSSGHNGTLSADCSGDRCPTAGLTGQFGNAALFDGGTDVLQVAQDVPQLDGTFNNFTMAAWINPNFVGDDLFHLFGRSALNSSETFSFLIFLNNLALETMDGTAPRATTPIFAHEWTHVAVSAHLIPVGSPPFYTGFNTVVTYYINGQPVDTFTLEDNFGLEAAASDPILIGSTLVNTEPSTGKPNPVNAVNRRQYSGLIDELVVYDRALSAAEIMHVKDGRYNVTDNIVARDDELRFESTTTNQLLSRNAKGLLQTELPPVVTGTTNDRDFTLTRNNGTSSNQLVDAFDLTVNSNAATGSYGITQYVGAHVDEPTAPLPQQEVGQVFREEPATEFNGTDDKLSKSSSNYALGGTDFTLSTWINPDEVDGLRAIMGWEANRGNGYPSLFIENGKLRMGFGDENNVWQEDTTSGVYFTEGVWTHVAVSYDRQAKRGTLFINGTKVTNDQLAFTSNPGDHGGYFELGRASNRFTVDFGELEVRCEYDNGGPHYDLVYEEDDELVAEPQSGLHWSQSFRDDVEEHPSERVVNDIAPPLELREGAVFEMCENDPDGSEHTRCMLPDEDMGTLNFNYYSPSTTVTDHTFVRGSRSCSLGDGYSDWIEVDYTYSTYSLPFDGIIKDTRIIKRTMTANEVTNLFQSATFIARYRMNDVPATMLFDDELVTAVGRCEEGSCPLSGVAGRENVAAYFNGVDEFVSANEVSTLARAAADSPETHGISYGAWINPDEDFASLDPGTYFMSFHSSAGVNAGLLGIISQGNGDYKIRYFDDGNNDSNTTLSAGAWRHIFITIDYSTNTAKLYIDGVLDRTFSTSLKPAASGKFTIGMEFDNSTKSDFFKGFIDDVVVAKGSLSQSQVFEIYQSAPLYTQSLDYGQRYFSLDSTDIAFNSTNGTELLMINGQRVAQLKAPTASGGATLFTYSDHNFPIAAGRSVIEVRATFNTGHDGRLVGQFEIDELIPDGSYSKTFTSGGTPVTINYTIRTAKTANPADIAWLSERPSADRGQIGGAMRFGITTTRGIALPENSYGINGGQWTVAAWVKPTDVDSNVYQPIVASSSDSSVNFHYIGLKNGHPYILRQGISNGSDSFMAPEPIPTNVWSHITIRWQDFDKLEMFVNGSSVGTVPVSTGAGLDVPLLGRGHHVGQGMTHFSGSIDAATYYNSAISNEEIVKLYNYQVTWQDETAITPLIVDATAPTGEVTPFANSFFTETGTTVMLKGVDTTQLSAQLRITRVADNTIERQLSAPNCSPSGQNTFCVPTGTLDEGAYALTTNMVDAVGQQSGYGAPAYIVIDTTPPVNITSGADISVAPFRPESDTDDGAWLVPLSGTVQDPIIASNNVGIGMGQQAGSGVAKISVSLIDANGTRIGDPGVQTLPASALEHVLVNNIAQTNWTHSFKIRSGTPTGVYTLTLQLEDNAGNATGEITVQSADTRNATGDLTIELDVTNPEVAVNSFGVPGQSSRSIDEVLPYALNRQTLLEGTVDERPESAETQSNVSGISSVEYLLEPQFPHGTATNINALPASVELFLPLDRSQPDENADDNSFIDIVAGRTATCAGASCPLSGISSPNGSGLLFDGVDDVLTMPNDAINQMTNDFTVAAWIKPQTLSGTRKVVSTARSNSNNNGFGLGHTDGRLTFTTFGVKGYVTTVSYLAPSRWQHIAVHLNSNNDAEFYLNGVLVETVTHNAPARADTDDVLMIGAMTSLGSPTPVQPFDGTIDSVAIAAGRVSDHNWWSIFGLQPTIHLPFDERTISDREALYDASEMGSDSVIINVHTNDVTNMATSGHVGSGALRTTSFPIGAGIPGQTILITSAVGTMPAGNEPFTVAVWGRLTGRQQVTIDFGRTLTSEKASFYFWEDRMVTLGGHGTVSEDAAGGNDEWHHYAWTYDGSTVALYFDGQLVKETAASGSNNFALDGTELIAVNGGAGAIDDLRIYKRALNAGEMAELYNTSWQPAVLPARAIAAEQSSWDATLPDDVEGFYKLSVRGADLAGNVDEESLPVWSGLVDTKMPTMIITEVELGNGSYLYGIFAEDFAIREQSLTVPEACANVTTTLRATNDSPWLLALRDQLGTEFAPVRVIEYTCESSAQLPPSSVMGICDLAGNCQYQTIDGSAVPTAITMQENAVLNNPLATVVVMVFALFTLLLTATFLRRRRD